MKVHIGILTSRYPEKALRCFRSILAQRGHDLDVSIAVIVNSVKGYYYDDVVKAFDGNVTDIVNTPSNGRPGKGKNHGWEYLRNSCKADYYMLLDGDDFLYPPALSILSAFMEQKWDLINGQSSDQWFNGKLHKTWGDLQPNNCINYNRDLLTKEPEPNYEIYSVDRIYAVSRKFLQIMPKFNEELDLHEDFLYTVECTELVREKRLKYITMNTSFVYGYDMDGEHQVGIFQTDTKLARWNIEKFFELAKEYVPVEFSKNLFAEVSLPTDFTHQDKQAFYETINKHETYSGVK